MRAEVLAKYKSTLRSQFAESPKTCSQCKQTRPRTGGGYLTYNAGRNQRWRCASCGGAGAEL